ncbi:MAG: hypothetical protein ACREP7_18120 [Lysobacter sp.]
MKIAIFVRPLLLGPLLLAAAASAHAQSQDGARDALQQAATGAAFRIGYTQFRLAPEGVVSAAGAAQSAGAQAVRVGDYAVQLQPATARTLRAAKVKPRLAAAVGDDGKAVVVTSTLNVYHSNPASLQDAVRVSGGTLVYSSVAGGAGRIEFDSVDAAMKAMAKIQSIAGIKEVAPEIVEGEDAPN